MLSNKEALHLFESQSHLNSELDQQLKALEPILISLSSFENTTSDTLRLTEEEEKQLVSSTSSIHQSDVNEKLHSYQMTLLPLLIPLLDQSTVTRSNGLSEAASNIPFNNHTLLANRNPFDPHSIIQALSKTSSSNVHSALLSALLNHSDQTPLSSPLLSYGQFLNESQNILSSLVNTLSSLTTSSSALATLHESVTTATNAIREESVAKLQEERHLLQSADRYAHHLHYYTAADEIEKQLKSVIVVHSHGATSSLPAALDNASFPSVLNTIDECIEYLQQHLDFIESGKYKERYVRMRSHLLTMLTEHLSDGLAQTNKAFRAERQKEKENKSKRNNNSGTNTPRNPSPTPLSFTSSPAFASSNAATPSSSSSLLISGPTADISELFHSPLWLKTFVSLRTFATNMAPLVKVVHERAFLSSSQTSPNSNKAKESRGFSNVSKTPKSSLEQSASTLQQSANDISTYHRALNQLYFVYTSKRTEILTQEFSSYMSSNKPATLTAHLRSSFNLLLELAGLEWQLCETYFPPSPSTEETVRNIISAVCSTHYTFIRPLVVHESDIDVLCESLGMLKEEIISIPIISTKVDTLTTVSRIIPRLVADLQERLAYRVAVYVRESISGYQSKPDDFDYMNKLAKAQLASSGEQSELNDTSSTSSSPACAVAAASASAPVETSTSKWHPIVERTLILLSKLYRSVELSVFKYLAQNAVSSCVGSLLRDSKEMEMRSKMANRPFPGASTSSSSSSSPSSASPMSSRSPETAVGDEDDVLLFLILQLLTLRTHLSAFPFDVIVSKQLDFSHMYDVLPNIFSSRGKYGSFVDLVNSSIRISEKKMDSRAMIEVELKRICEQFIAKQTQSLIGTLLVFFQRMSAQQVTAQGINQDPVHFGRELVSILFSLTNLEIPQGIQVSFSIQHARVDSTSSSSPFESNILRVISKTSLYLSNPQTERILFHPIYRTLHEVFEQLQFFVQTHFAPSSTTIITEESLISGWLKKAITILDSGLNRLPHQ